MAVQMRLAKWITGAMRTRWRARYGQRFRPRHVALLILSQFAPVAAGQPLLMYTCRCQHPQLSSRSHWRNCIIRHVCIIYSPTQPFLCARRTGAAAWTPGDHRHQKTGFSADDTWSSSDERLNCLYCHTKYIQYTVLLTLPGADFDVWMLRCLTDNNCIIMINFILFDDWKAFIHWKKYTVYNKHTNRKTI